MKVGIATVVILMLIAFLAGSGVAAWLILKNKRLNDIALVEKDSEHNQNKPSDKTLEQGNEKKQPGDKTIGQGDEKKQAGDKTLNGGKEKTKDKPDPGPIAKGKVLINLNGNLALTDPIDPTPRGREAKARMNVHPMQMQVGTTYVMSMNSNVVDSYLRLENPQGQTIAEDDDGGGFPNARIVHRCTQTGVYRIIATTFRGQTGPYQLIVVEAGGPHANPKDKPKGGDVPVLRK